MTLDPAMAHVGLPPRLSGVVHLFVVGALWLVCGLLLETAAVAALYLAVAAASYVLVLVLYRAARMTGDALNVLSLSMIAMLLLYPLHGVVMRDSPMVKNLLGGDRDTFFTYALVVATMGAWAMYRGFATGRPGPVSRLVERASRPIDDLAPTLDNKLVLLMVAGIVARVALVASGTGTHVDLGGPGAGASSSAHFLLDALSATSRLAALYLLATGARHHLRRRVWLGAGYLLVEALWGGLFSGSRYLLFVPLLSAAAVYSAVVKPVSLRRLVTLMFVFVTVAFPLATAYKTAYSSRLVELQRQGLSASAVLDSLESTGSADSDDWADLVGQRFHALTSLALIIRYTPERHPYLWGEPYALLPLDIAVPRLVWPDKPVLRQFTLDFRFDYFKLDRGSRTSVAPSQFGELWANLSLFGLLLGAWVWGRILRFMYAFLYLGGRASLFGKAAYATALPALLSVMETETVTGMAAIAKSLVIWVACTWLLGQRRRRGGLARPPHAAEPTRSAHASNPRVARLAS
ncbi:MAG: hypothetical protein CVU56_14180 [Deltaproteobacteria bacterium HGW-Deltaproteobacteria-14]|nr:MAG: hypothetical protein CVU56_14180 [Deltaproteobacteria bacterium HGW-Deltaproteobacteria-14]